MTDTGASAEAHPTFQRQKGPEGGAMRNDCAPSVFPLRRVTLREVESRMCRPDGSDGLVPLNRRRVRRALQDVNETVLALNWQSGCKSFSTCVDLSTRVQSLHDSAAERVITAVLSRGEPDQAPTSREALSGLLRGRGLYSDETSSQASVAPYGCGLRFSS